MAQTVTAHLRYIRLAPRKVRLVADLVRGKKVPEARVILRMIPKGATHPLEKLLASAIASATNTYSIDESNLLVSSIMVGEGPKLKRFMPRMRGSASPIQKKTSHITVTLREIEPGKKAVKQKKEVVTTIDKKDRAVKRSPSVRPEKQIKKSSEGVKQKMFRRKAVA